MNCKSSVARKGLMISCLITLVGMGIWNYVLSKQMVEKNTRIINLMAVNAKFQSTNSDIIIDIHRQFLTLDGEFDEEFGLALVPVDPVVEDLSEHGQKQMPKGEPVPSNMKQVLSDLNDIEKFSMALASNQLFQRQSLETILERVKELMEKKMDKDDRKEVEKPLKNVYNILYGGQDMKIISDKKLDEFKWSFVPLKDR